MGASAATWALAKDTAVDYPTGMKGKRTLTITVALLIFIGIPIFLTWNFMLAPMFEWRRAMSALIGMKEDQVRTALGKPKFVLTPAQIKEKGIDAPWREMQYVPVPERQVHGPVWLYEERTQAGWRGLYVFFSADGRVEAIDSAAR
jgi:hypothetical protein